jgi:hypothetical protein
MVGQCPNCKGFFGIQQEWIGSEAQCPHCQSTILVQCAQPPTSLTVNCKKINLWEILLVIVGIFHFASGFIWRILYKISGSSFFQSRFYELWNNGLCLVIPVIGCIISIGYFKSVNAQDKKIRWEYIGIVTSFLAILHFVIYLCLATL